MKNEPNYSVPNSTNGDYSQSSLYQQTTEKKQQKVEIDPQYTVNKPRRVFIRARIIDD